jgi:hypothetical protein
MPSESVSPDVDEFRNALKFIVDANPRNANKHKLLVEWFDGSGFGKGRGSVVSELKQAYNRVPEQFKHADQHVVFVCEDEHVRDKVLEQAIKFAFPELHTVLLVDRATLEPRKLFVRGAASPASVWYQNHFKSLAIEHSKADTPSAGVPTSLGKFSEQFGTGADQVTRIISALAAKGFVILTGNSGTGKTWIATQIAHAMCAKGESQMVAVEADWTDSRALVGYINYLRPKNPADPKDGFVYESTPIVDLLTSANANPESPHVLILDEMNLSHVERYFADFLSAMELEKGVIALHHDDAIESPPKELAYPQNLYVIGTVNVDETTYMFSPKVLDRASVFEFECSRTDLEAYLKRSETPTIGGDDALSAEFAGLVAATRADGAQAFGSDDAARKQFEGNLLDCFEIARECGWGFGFRTVKEATAYAVARSLIVAGGSPPSPAEVFDEVLLQKILPKLNGGPTRLSSILEKLLKFCADSDAPDTIRFQRSAEKLEQMQQGLHSDQFASYIR